MKTERKYYIDNLRWLWIVMLIPFHAAMAWNNWEGNYIWFHENKVLSSFVMFIAPWYMPLLFVLAGISMKYSMRRRSYGEFVIERIKKLVIPLITGVLTVVAFMAYVADQYHNGYTGSFLQHYRVFFTNITDLTGYDGNLTPGHLWFVLYLIIISMILLVLVAAQKKFLSKLSFASIKVSLLPVLILFPVIMAPILDFGGKSIGEDLALFLLGYYIFSEEEVMEKMTKYRYIYFAIMFVCDIMLNYLYVWEGERTGLIVSVCEPCSEWFGILAFLGIARCNFNQNNQFTRYMSSRSFLIYIFHFGWLVLFQYLLGDIITSTAGIYLLAVIGTAAMTLLTCELIRKIPGVRFLFGEK